MRTHVAMLAAGIRRHDRREVVGQLLRLVVAGPGSLTGRYPVGNTGGADVNALTPMPIPDDLVPVPVVRHPHRGAAMNHRPPHDPSTTVLHRPDRPRRQPSARPSSSWPTATPSSCASPPSPTQLGDDRVRMLAYNGSIPGPTLRVRQGSEITVHVRNDADIEATVHWHGLRLDNAYDGVPHETQAPIPVGGDFTYRLRFPDAGLYWYHPHIREDYGLDMGLYGNLVVDPVDDDYWPPVNREHVVTLDDVLVEDGRIAPFNVDGPTHVAMGRFGNVMLTAGETEPRRCRPTPARSCASTSPTPPTPACSTSPCRAPG